MTGQEQSGGLLLSEIRHIPPALKHFPPVVVDCLQLSPRAQVHCQLSEDDWPQRHSRASSQYRL